MIWIATIWKFIKPLAPYILAIVAVLGAYWWIYDKGHDAGVEQGYHNAIGEVAKVVKNMPDLKCDCPKIQPCPALIDDKIKGKNIYVTIHQNNTVEMSGDTLVLNSFTEVVRKLLDERQIVRAKRL